MVMKVNGFYNVYFKSAGTGMDSRNKPVHENAQITALSNVTPDFRVNLPLKYQMIGRYKLENGLEVYSYKLANGYKVNIVPMEGSPAVVKNYVNVGSMNESANIKGISHFLEHMAFNGTNGDNGHIKLEPGDSFKKIDELGGWANASTNYAITDYVNSTPLLNRTDLEKQIQVIASMTEDLKLADNMISKEKGPVCSEINMILDNPQTIAMDQTVRTLFNIKNPADEMVGGSVKTIKSLTREDVKSYYDKYYTPDNMSLVITGDVNPDEVIMLVAQNFNSQKTSAGRRFEEKLIPLSHTVRKDFINDKAVSTDVVLGFAGPKNSDVKGKVVFDLAKAYIESQECGLDKNLRKYNAYPYIDSEKISTNPNSPRMVYLAFNTSEKYSEPALRSVFASISEIAPVSDKTLEVLKQKIRKERENSLEYSSVVNDSIGKAVLDGNIEYFTQYEKLLDSITADDVDKAVKEYFNLKKASVTLVHPKAESVSFKGNSRKPVNMQKVSEYTLDNNFTVGLYETKNRNVNYNIALCLDQPYKGKPGVIEVLNEIYEMGAAGINEDDWNKFQEENNMNLYASLTNSKLKISSNGILNNRHKVFESAEKLLYNPNLTQENLKEAIGIVRDNIQKRQNTAQRLYYNWECANNPYESSEDEILSNLDSITLEDLRDCHNYIINNSRGIITANVPKDGAESVKEEILASAENLKQVLPNNVKTISLYKENNAPVVLTKATNNSQADIMQVYKFKTNNTIKETVAGEILNSILTNSSIGLFNVLREKEHLAYSVYSSIDKCGDRGELSCNILTTTDNKEIGEISYENVQKSIDGFKRQINELKSGSFSAEDLENAKLAMKAGLIENEGTANKLGSISLGLNSKYGIDYANKLYDEIDKITKNDIVNLAQKIFSSKPVYCIAASKDTINNNKSYLETLSQ